MKKIILLLLSAFLIVTLTSCSAQKEEAKQEKVLKMGFVPVKDSETLIDDVKPIADALSQKLGVKVEAFTASNYIGVVEGIGSGSVDFGFIPPFAYLLAKEKNNVTALLTSKGLTGEAGYYSYLYTTKDSGINSIEDIKGKRVAFVDPSSTSGYIYPGAMLVNAGINLEKDVTTLFTGGHDKSLQLLLNGDVDVIASYGNLAKKFNKDFPEAEEKVKELSKSDLIPGITLVASNQQLDEEMQKKLFDAFKEIEKDPQTMEIFKKMFNITGFNDVDEPAYKKVEDTAKIMNVDLKKAK